MNDSVLETHDLVSIHLSVYFNVKCIEINSNHYFPKKPYSNLKFSYFQQI